MKDIFCFMMEVSFQNGKLEEEFFVLWLEKWVFMYKNFSLKRYNV